MISITSRIGRNFVGNLNIGDKFKRDDLKDIYQIEKNEWTLVYAKNTRTLESVICHVTEIVWQDWTKAEKS